MDDLVCSRCGHNITEDDDKDCITRIYNRVTKKDVLLCPRCTFLFNLLTDMFLNMETKIEATEVE